MTPIEVTLYLLGGMAGLFIGAEGLIRGSSLLALRMGISPLVVGLTVVSFGTSSPELVISIEAGLKGSGGIAVGNVIGSNIANIALILGASALITPIFIQGQVIKKDLPIMVGITVLFILFLYDERLGIYERILFVSGLVVYLVLSIYSSRKENNKRVLEEIEESLPKDKSNVWLMILFIVAGLGLLILGAHLFLDGAVELARSLGVSDVIIGLTVVAIGTSLPELITSVVAAFKNESDIAVGNIVGSNIFNILAILGIASIISPLDASGINTVDILILFLSAIILWPLSKTGSKLNRIEGAGLLLAYFGYIYYLLP
jgi:cation:H+ antiporter